MSTNTESTSMTSSRSIESTTPCARVWVYTAPKRAFAATMKSSTSPATAPSRVSIMIKTRAVTMASRKLPYICSTLLFSTAGGVISGGSTACCFFSISQLVGYPIEFSEQYNILSQLAGSECAQRIVGELCQLQMSIQPGAEPVLLSRGHRLCTTTSAGGC